jgi:ligand-binding sensor domain-containing protein/two-component sensor histidine kinase
MLNRVVYTVLLLLSCALLYSQEKRYVFTHFTTRQGLASDYVYSILQDKQGFMWFATANGLQRYDGRKIISFRAGPADTAFLPPEGIGEIMIDKSSRYWVRFGKEVGLFDRATFAYKPVPMEVSKQDLERSDLRLYEDNEGNVFVTYTRSGILVYDAKANAFVKKPSVIDAPTDVFIVGIQQDPADGNYWIGTDHGMRLFHRKNKQLYSPANNPINNHVLANPIINQPVTAFLIDSFSRLWIGNWQTKANSELFGVYDMKSRRLTPLKISGGKEYYHELHAFRQQRNGKIWAHGLTVLAQYIPATNQLAQLSTDNNDDLGIRFDRVHCFYEDRENNIWLGTNQGIYVFNPDAQRFTSISMQQQQIKAPAERSYTSFIQLNNGDVMSGSWGQGVYTYDNNFRLKGEKLPAGPHVVDPNYSMVWSMVQQGGQRGVWMGCQAGRLMIYDPITKTVKYIRSPVFNERTIRCMAEDKQGIIWMGTQHGLLVKWDPVKGRENLEAGFELVRTFNSSIYTLKIDDTGLLWIGTQQQGLYVTDALGNDVEHYTTKSIKGKSLYREMVTDVMFYNDSTVAICAGTLNLLNRRTGNIRFITTEDGLPSNTVNTVQKDKEDNLWVGLIDGLCRYNVRKNIFTLFSQKDGIVRNDFHNGSSYALRDGRMIFSNPHDFVYFNPQQILPSSAPPDVSITDFKLFNQYLPPDSIVQLEKVILAHNQNSITIEFAALSFLQRDKMVYYTKMEGIDKDWTRVQLYNVSNYALLPPGDYTFKVRCENGDGIPSKNITSLRIYIRPPFWQQEWFIMLGIFAIAALIYLAHRIRVSQLMQMEKVRGRIARDLHDDMGSTLSTINILSEMAKMKVGKDTDKTSEYISKISDNSNRMMEAMDDIVWSINPMNDSMQRITARMREFATGVLEAKDIEVSFKVDDKVKDLRLDMESRRDFFLIFKEAVNNIAKYSQCRRTYIDITVHAHKLVMQIRDDGKGFDVQQADSGNGLSNMKKRAESLKGSLSIESLPGVGTKVRLEAPLT